jgi:class 3 adenylate cyclase
MKERHFDDLPLDNTSATDARFSCPASRSGNRVLDPASPGQAVLCVIGVPTLILHRRGDRAVEHPGYLAAHIESSKQVEPNGDNYDSVRIGEGEIIERDRVLATVLFTDIVNSTLHANELGDHSWRELLDQHNSLMEAQVHRFRGRLVRTTGDGILATFDGPGRAILCACSAIQEVSRLGIQIRSGLHTGEVELTANDVRGIAVHTAARVAEKAQPNEVWISRTVQDLVAGSRFKFNERGSHELKGFSGNWPLFAVEP